MSDKTKDVIVIIFALLLYGVVGGMEMRDQEEFEKAFDNKQIAAKKQNDKTPTPQPHVCKIRTKKDSCITKLA